jgi:small-conductance mechanosensitive channel
MKALDDQIGDASNLISLLLVFVFAYFSAIWPQLTVLLGTSAPGIAADRHQLADRLHGYEKLLRGLVVLVVAVAAILAPLTGQVVVRLSLTGAYHVQRAGLLMVNVLLLTLLVVLAATTIKVAHRRRTLVDLGQDN